MRRALICHNLYGRETVRHKLKNSLKTQKTFLSVFELMSDSLTATQVEPNQCPSHQSILLTQEPIPLNLAKWFFFESAILDFFFKKKFFFCLIPWKVVKGSWIARIGRNFDDYPGFHPFRSWANTYAQDCTVYCLTFQTNLNHLVQIRSNCFKFDQIRSSWIKLVQIRSNKIKLDQIGTKNIKILIFWFKSNKIGPNSINLNPIGSNWNRSNVDMSNFLQFWSRKEVLNQLCYLQELQELLKYYQRLKWIWMYRMKQRIRYRFCQNFGAWFSENLRLISSEKI